MKQMKIVQVAATGNGTDWDTIYILTDDGILWMGTDDPKKIGNWTRVDGPPGKKEKDMPQESAVDVYLDRNQAALDMIDKIKAHLENHGGVNPDEIHWGHAGDMGRVVRDLGDICEYLFDEVDE